MLRIVIVTKFLGCARTKTAAVPAPTPQIPSEGAQAFPNCPEGGKIEHILF